MIRYPGSKAKIATPIMARFPSSIMDALFQGSTIEYREPFFGGGAIGWQMLDKFPSRCRIWLNDKDYGLVCLWKAVLDAPDELLELVESFEPTVDAFYRFKEEDSRTDIEPVRFGFQKFALHQTSFSGNGAMAGGPIGGRKQRSEFNVHCRWSPSKARSTIRARSDELRRFIPRPQITSGDFERLIVGAPATAFIYCDPPYYKAGPQLYKHSMSDDDHRRLATALRGCAADWLLSYDDCPFIRELYEPWALIESVGITYTTAVASGKRRKNSELIIRPRRERHKGAA